MNTTSPPVALIFIVAPTLYIAPPFAAEFMLKLISPPEALILCIPDQEYIAPPVADAVLLVNSTSLFVALIVVHPP